MAAFVLYILTRKDMLSLDHTGKLIAQGAHAANHAAESILRNDFGPEIMRQFSEWQKQTPQGFGTTIVLGGIKRIWDSAKGLTVYDINETIGYVKGLGFAADVIVDPTYPLKDGATMHTFPCATAAWIFGDKAALEPHLENLLLHPPTPQWSMES